ncbi:MAG: dual specificity protein phosphatase family protein [Patescibacteria group bacterium]|nr:dual specificity protein phosphatase family protein [Patescibacteria group bacterium]
MEHVHDPSAPLDYNYITDGIYEGTNQCCSIGLSEVLKREGIVADMSLEDTRLDQPFGVEAYVWLPTKDHTPPSQDQLSFGAAALEQWVAQKKKVYLHCKNGHGRASTVLAAYLINQGHDPESAFALIQKHRSAAHLQDSQKEALQTYWKNRSATRATLHTSPEQNSGA